MDIVRRAQSAYRIDAVRQLLEVLGAGVGVVGFAWWLGWKLSRGEVSAVDWVLVGAECCALVYLGVFFRNSARQRAKSRELLSDTPQSLVNDLMQVHERELHAWVNKWALATCGLVGVTGIAWTVITTIRANAAGKLQSPALAWGALCFLVLSLVALAVFGRYRVRFLRRELSSLRDIQRELDASERGGL
ncbi:MAG TPA: hypothetical protein VMG12_28990 [Polyangiaceae bacterium]|nr:hypothetical protein [Polyangiaceae bacterium]